MNSRAGDWLKQAQSELAWAEDTYSNKRWAFVCFTAQQVAEKSLKAIAIARGALEVRSHSLVKISEALGIDGDMVKMGRRLDVYFISTRNPDAFAEGAPYEYFDREQAEEALAFAKRFVERARAEILSHG